MGPSEGKPPNVLHVLVDDVQVQQNWKDVTVVPTKWQRSTLGMVVFCTFEDTCHVWTGCLLGHTCTKMNTNETSFNLERFCVKFSVPVL